MTTIQTEDIEGKKADIAKKIKYYSDKLEQAQADLDALERVEKILTGVAESATERRRKEIGEAVLVAIGSKEPMHYKDIAAIVTQNSKHEIKPGAMYNFLNRAIEKKELQIQRTENGLYIRTKEGASSTEGESSVTVSKTVTAAS